MRFFILLLSCFNLVSSTECPSTRRRSNAFKADDKKVFLNGAEKDVKSFSVIEIGNEFTCQKSRDFIWRNIGNIFKCLVEELAVLHARNKLYGDMQLSNVIVVYRGDGNELEFARAEFRRNHDEFNVPEHKLAPEHIREGFKPMQGYYSHTKEAEMWAFGIVMWEIWAFSLLNRRIPTLEMVRDDGCRFEGSNFFEHAWWDFDSESDACFRSFCEQDNESHHFTHFITERLSTIVPKVPPDQDEPYPWYIRFAIKCMLTFHPSDRITSQEVYDELKKEHPFKIQMDEETQRAQYKLDARTEDQRRIKQHHDQRKLQRLSELVQNTTPRASTMSTTTDSSSTSSLASIHSLPSIQSSPRARSILKKDMPRSISLGEISAQEAEEQWNKLKSTVQFKRLQRQKKMQSAERKPRLQQRSLQEMLLDDKEENLYTEEQRRQLSIQKRQADRRFHQNNIPPAGFGPVRACALM